MTTRWTGRLGLVSLIALGLASASARAEEGVAIKNLLGKMGIVPEDKEPIRYRERAPLALPPKGVNLRQPLAPADYASSNAQWPNDPDVAARKRREADSLLPVGQSQVRRMADRNTALTPEEMRASRTDLAPEQRAPGYGRGDNARDVLYLTPEQMRAGSRPPEGETEDKLAEPRRRTLTEPPSGFRKSATGGKVEAIAAAPRVDQQAIDANPMNWFRRQFSHDDDE